MTNEDIAYPKTTTNNITEGMKINNIKRKRKWKTHESEKEYMKFV